jgi:putative transposase
MARIVVPGWPHHVTQRGNRRQTVFYSDWERIVYLRMMKKYCDRFSLDTLAYSLMTNHTHHAVIPKFKESLAGGIGRTHHDYSAWNNLLHDKSGHLWQCRYFSCPIEGDGIWTVMAYAELNPMRAGLVENAWDWEWSSARAHVTGRDDTGLLNMEFWRKHFDGNSWRKFLEAEAANYAARDRIRALTRTGRPFASKEAILKLEQQLGRPILPRKPGRKANNHGDY